MGNGSREGESVMTASWTDVPWLGFDTETTGIDPSSDRIVSAALVLRLGGATSEVPDRPHTWLANPGVPIPEAASAVHGISTEYAREHGRPISEVIDEVAATLVAHWQRGFPVVAFNATYDITILDAELKRHGVATLMERLSGAPMLVVDPLVLDRHFDRYRKGKKTLTTMAPAYGVEADEDAHTAEVDVAMTLDVLAAMSAKIEALAGLTPLELHELQVRVHAEWAENFESYLRRQGRDARISRAWPHY